MPLAVFSAVISLGTTCQTAYQTRRRFGFETAYPFDWLVIPPGIARFEGAGVARRAPHPNAALLFLAFLVTDAQELLLNRDFFPASRKTRALPSGLSVTFLDPAKGLDENQKWSKYYREIITNRVR